ncbi:putative hydrolase [Actinacidiphila reveromycinica]|uniref:Putative hydrolase n=1 Tax=Actinacidiphila reveromycinica TaxID=659352 RepID=A0A7U3URS5_9ACTN|nr:alpha/beta fold hydrolase [Streptomyces sp. SN-593]BBA97503.1 putative hydrolase [Streptomyces sp. SN-593]
MATADLDGTALTYQVTGTGPRLLFLNGSGGTLVEAAPLLLRLAGRFEVAAFDQRGIGRSAAASGPYAMADLAADAAALADHLGWPSFRVFGISFGGMVAQELAVTRPERIERMALLCTSSGGPGGSSYPLHTLGELPLEERQARYAGILDTRFTAEWLASRPGDRAVVESMRGRLAAGKPAAVRLGEELQLRARAAHDVYDRLPAVTCPTLVAAGRYDGIAPVANSEAVARAIPGAELRVFEGGHIFPFQDPEALPAVIDFLAR